ncbi:hypothetical protein D6789_04910 [Candidatus Woesearchaeota archaeon]|nr:MAG: hypothetical protein D6789_04910 [Candidatus Woesearchaeota archaeon]
MRYIRTLAQIHRGEEDLVGQRGRNLALLSQKGFTTPLAFVLTNDAFESFIHQNNLQERIGTILMEECTGTRRYDQIRELILNGEFSKELVREIVEAYESLGDGEDLLATNDAAFVSVILSPNHSVPDENKEGIILNVHGLEQLLLAIKECWACLFTPSLQRHRAAAGISVKHLNVGVLVERKEPGEVTAETWSATSGDKNLLTVKTYYGAIDLHGTIEKDEMRLAREYLKPVYQSVAIQTALLTTDEDDRLAKLPLGARGEEQTLNDRDMIELGRLTKKASTILDEQVKLYFAVHKERMSVLLCTGLLLTKGSVKLDGFSEEERIEEAPAALEEPTAREASETTEAPGSITTGRGAPLERAAELDAPTQGSRNPEPLHSSKPSAEPATEQTTESLRTENTMAEVRTTAAEPIEEDAGRKEGETAEEPAEELAEEPGQAEDLSVDKGDSPEYTPAQQEEEQGEEQGVGTEAEELESEAPTTDSPKEPQPEEPQPEEPKVAPSLENDESIFSGINRLAQGYERVKEALRRRYAERFKGPIPESPRDMFFELSSEVTLPHEEEIGQLVRIMEEGEAYDQAQEATILEAIDDFCNRA